MPISLALLGLGLTFASWGVYMAAIARERVPPRPLGHVAAQVGALAASLVAIVVGPSIATIAAAVLTVPLAALFLFLLSQAPVPDATIRVAVGQPLLAFSAQTSEGASWSTEQLRGRRVLLKFFRGAW